MFESRNSAAMQYFMWRNGSYVCGRDGCVVFDLFERFPIRCNCKFSVIFRTACRYFSRDTLAVVVLVLITFVTLYVDTHLRVQAITTKTKGRLYHLLVQQRGCTERVRTRVSVWCARPRKCRKTVCAAETDESFSKQHFIN